MPQVDLALVGAGDRGTRYTRYATTDGRARLAAVAEPDPRRREALLADHPEAVGFGDWRELAEQPRLADAVVIATLDADHVEPAVRFAELGYHILLEKPMAIRLEDCRRIVAAAERAGVLFAVCHVMRYTSYTRGVKAVLDSGRLGEIVNIEHLEPVGWWHHAHSYVRGNWRRTDQATFMLLAKSCHDLDWLTYVMGRRVTRVSSFGGLKHFTADNQPAGAAERCLDCAVADACPYDAKRIYLPFVGGQDRWPLAVLSEDTTEAGVLRALREGPYGRCVYACDNDVVDHQVVSLDFDGGATASFTMTAFSPKALRQTRVFGTRGSLEGDGARLTVTDFVTGAVEVIDTKPPEEGHSGGDQGLVTAFLDALSRNDPSPILSDPRESLHSHEIAWAAEEARLTGTVVTLKEQR
ncbi:Gfo/Idh/MocA family protein [Nonomuraea pusilla]|uniref:Oxidoreductase family, C-terminal alpha/beta domain n=1 Tax=Nonomuraea pusilla TaxID=46177 RepID=A0A1H8CCI5_9ACTN|nr:Gfo/Idh/MocA family oxidoreductase [Nonomuraea pusilla]SEM91978.1 Oxidoreductase family, C-terminal alpha/beta domain [Nonomuraea pusilla]